MGGKNVLRSIHNEFELPIIIALFLIFLIFTNPQIPCDQQTYGNSPVWPGEKESKVIPWE